MKIRSMLLLIVFVPGLASAQSVVNAQDIPDLVIIKYSWSKVHLLQRGNTGNSSLETYDQVRERVGDERRITDAKNSNNKNEAARIESVAQMREDAKRKVQQQKSARPRLAYNYKVTLQNRGPKTIKSIDWDYIFFDPATRSEVSRHQFTSDEKISPDKSKELTVLYANPPIQTINASELSKKETISYRELVEISRILYSDGSVWLRH